MTTKTAAPTLASDDGQSGRVVMILPRPDGEVRIAERSYQGKPFIDLRFYWKTETGETLPTKKGITLRSFELAKVAATLQDLAPKEEGAA